MELGLRFLLQITYRRPVCLSSYDWIKSCLFKSFLYRTEIGHFDDFEWFLDNMSDFLSDLYRKWNRKREIIYARPHFLPQKTI